MSNIEKTIITLVEGGLTFKQAFEFGLFPELLKYNLSEFMSSKLKGKSNKTGNGSKSENLENNEKYD